MRARALIALDAGAIPTQERHARDINTFTVTEIVGDEHHEWAAAKASAVISWGRPRQARKWGW